MHCSTCESFLETLASRKEGIYKCEASYASEMIKVYYNSDVLDPDTLSPELSKLGYGVHQMDDDTTGEQLNEVGRSIIGGFLGIAGLLLYVIFLYPTYISGEGFIPLTA